MKVNKLDKKFLMWLLSFTSTNTKQTNKIWRKNLEMLIKIPGISGLVTTTVLNTKIGKFKNKIPVISDLV